MSDESKSRAKDEPATKRNTRAKPPEERFKVPFRVADKIWMLRKCLTDSVQKELGEDIVPLLKGHARERICREAVPQGIPDRIRLVQRCLPKDARENLYEVIVPLLDKETRERLGLRLMLPFYPQDPMVAAMEGYELLRPENFLAGRLPDAKKKSDRDMPPPSISWEPGLTHGPTSARLAVVDYNGDTGTVTEPALWNAKRWAFTEPDGTPIPAAAPHSSHFHQVSLWATVQTIIEFFEDPWTLGRPVAWAFPGNRLILVPHAGWGTNAFYDRRSKSLQFYCYGTPDEPQFTCLSHDIIAHETGHAVLDGIRPLYLEHSSQQTAAFHEFVADLTAVLTALRLNVARAIVARKEDEGAPPGESRAGEAGDGEAEVDGDGPLAQADFIAGLANQFGQYLEGRPYLRNARSPLVMADLGPGDSPHRCSGVLTGAMYEILEGIAGKKRDQEGDPSFSQALWWATDRFRRIAIQALDYCPPADIQFVDYARAVLRCYGLVSRRDSQGYGELMREVFHRRGLCPRPWEKCKQGGECALDYEQPPEGLLRRHDIDTISASRTGAYYFLHDNRRLLQIPLDQDVEVVDLYRTCKWDVGRSRLPRELVLEYVWREPVELADRRYGALEGRHTSLICGGTLVFDGRGNVVSWAVKAGRGDREGRDDRRRQRLREHIACLADTGAVALMEGGDNALGVLGPPVIARQGENGLSFEATPALRDHEAREAPAAAKETFEDRYGVEPWTTSF